MTFFVMGPIFDRINEAALQPWLAGEIEAPVAIGRAAPPLREFMLAQTRESDLALFSELSREEAPADVQSIPFKILVPSFLTSELKTAFQIGFLIFIPFLIIDLVVASVLMSMGMMMLSPLIISAPFKLMLFVLVDGWALVVGTLAGSFQG
jgi:flagellar biosynthetic protein FliP